MVGLAQSSTDQGAVPLTISSARTGSGIPSNRADENPAEAGSNPPASSLTDAASHISEVDRDKLLRDYSSGVVARIRAHQRYPASAERSGIEGKVKLSFIVDADGGLLSSNVVVSSGSPDLDGAALAALTDAAPFTAIPLELQRSSAKLSVTLNFQLK
jgi:protein TonB